MKSVKSVNSVKSANSKKGIGSGLLITFEGTEGAGKSTLIRLLADALRAQGQQVFITREPGGSVVSEKIRSLILDENMHAWTELFLYEASRAEHLHRTLLPALQSGQIVLCDRFTDSSLAYQAHARGLPWKEVEKLNHIATGGLKPHLTVLLDVDPELGLKKATVHNRFENEGIKFQKKVRQGFLKASRQDPRRWIKLAAHQRPAEQMAADLITLILKKRKSLTGGKRGKTWKNK